MHTNRMLALTGQQCLIVDGIRSSYRAQAFCMSEKSIMAKTKNGVLGPSRAKEDPLGQNTSVEDEIFLRIMDKEVYRNDYTVGSLRYRSGNLDNGCLTTVIST